MDCTFQAKVQSSPSLLLFPVCREGASAFASWPDLMPPEVEICAVQLLGRETRLREKPFVRLPALVQALTESLRPFYTNHSLFSVTAWGVRHIRALGEFHFGRPSSYQGYMVCHSIGFEKSSGHSCDTSFFNRVDMPRPCTHGGYGQYSCSRPNINNHITRFLLCHECWPNNLPYVSCHSTC